jgi:hypothetical protein
MTKFKETEVKQMFILPHSSKLTTSRKALGFTQEKDGAL